MEAIHEQVPKQGTIGDSLLHEMVPRTDGNRTLRGPVPLPKIEQRGFKPLNIRNTRRPIRIDHEKKFSPRAEHTFSHRSSFPMILVQLQKADFVTAIAPHIIECNLDCSVSTAIINNDDLAVIERSKLLERLIGRAGEQDVQQRVLSFIKTTDNELLKVACENLSTAASELEP